MGDMSSGAPARREWLIAAGISLAIISLASAPYLIGFVTEPAGYHFGGLLINPYDGNSYIAKMEIGRRGEWLFRLPYSAEPGPGAPIFMFYILLGHVAGWIGLPSILVFHIARVLAGLVMLLSLFAFVARFFETPGSRWTAWLLIALGSGLGWVAASVGAFTSDLWVAEAIPFLSIFANPHFPLAVALTLILYEVLVPGLSATGGSRALHIALAATALAQIQPFAMITVGAVVAVAYAAQRIAGPNHGSGDLRSRGQLARFHIVRLVIFALASVPWLVYDYYLTHTHPALRIWSAQNQTLSPPVWDYAVTFGLSLLLAIPGAWHAARRRNYRDLFLLAWVGANAVLLYVPLSFQRRLSLGLFVPVGLLAVQGAVNIIVRRLRRRRVALAAGLLIVLTLPSNLFVLLASLSGLAARNPLLFLRATEFHALQWLDANAPRDALVLASPEMGLFIPAYTLRRVIYAHPYETVNAQAEKQAVTDFYSGALTAEEARGFLAARSVKYVMYGPREAAIGPLIDPQSAGLRRVFREGDVEIYAR